jgi:hypothetical protein
MHQIAYFSMSLLLYFIIIILEMFIIYLDARY